MSDDLKTATPSSQAPRTNLISGQAGKESDREPAAFCISLKSFDPNQGQGFKEWEQAELLSTMLTDFHHFGQETLQKCVDKRLFTVYGHFPPTSEFKHPAHVTKDAVWASIHVQGRECVAGHVLGNVFYIVFLDRHHHFWPSKLKRT